MVKELVAVALLVLFLYGVVICHYMAETIEQKDKELGTWQYVPSFTAINADRRINKIGKVVTFIKWILINPIGSLYYLGYWGTHVGSPELTEEKPALAPIEDPELDDGK